MKKTITNLISFLLFIGFNSCDKPCDKMLIVGEAVRIPIQFNGFTISEIDKISVYRIDNSNTSLIDTMPLYGILWVQNLQSTKQILTDKGGDFGYYGSYFNNCDLILDWHIGTDTLSDFEVIKSKKAVEGCHSNDPNVKIDKFSFIHKGNIISNNQTIEINK